jgi:hypothetical protein
MERGGGEIFGKTYRVKCSGNDDKGVIVYHNTCLCLAIFMNHLLLLTFAWFIFVGDETGDIMARLIDLTIGITSCVIVPVVFTTRIRPSPKAAVANYDDEKGGGEDDESLQLAHPVN